MHLYSWTNHLDWISAVALLSAPGAPAWESEVLPNTDGAVKGNQDDIDLVVAFDAAAKSHLILLEAKGVTGWSNRQMNSKAERLKAIFGQEGNRFSHIEPSFAILSPAESRGLLSDSWPGWMARRQGRVVAAGHSRRPLEGHAL